MTDIDHFIKLGYTCSSEYEEVKDKDINKFFQAFKKTEEKRKDMRYMFKIFEAKLEYEDKQGLYVVNIVKCVGIVEFTKLGEYNNSIFQLLTRQAFFFDQDFIALTDLYNKFADDTDLTPVNQKDIRMMN